MSWGIFKIGDWIKGLITPKWLKKLLKELQDIIVSIIYSVGMDYLNQIQVKILEVNNQNIPPEEKFRIVFRFSKDLLPTAKDSILNALINMLVLKIKKEV